MSKGGDDSCRNPPWKFLLHSHWSVSYRSEVKARQDVKPDIRQPPFTDYRQPPVDYRHPPVADYRQPPTLDYRHPPLLDYRQLATDARQFAIPEYRMPPVQVRKDFSLRMRVTHPSTDSFLKVKSYRIVNMNIYIWNLGHNHIISVPYSSTEPF